MPLSIKGRIILEILEATVYLAEKNIIHKDIKPENILVDKDFHIKVWPMVHVLIRQCICSISAFFCFSFSSRLQTSAWPYPKHGAS